MAECGASDTTTSSRSSALFAMLRTASAREKRFSARVGLLAKRIRRLDGGKLNEFRAVVRSMGWKTSRSMPHGISQVRIPAGSRRGRCEETTITASARGATSRVTCSRTAPSADDAPNLLPTNPLEVGSVEGQHHREPLTQRKHAALAPVSVDEVESLPGEIATQ